MATVVLLVEMAGVMPVHGTPVWGQLLLWRKRSDGRLREGSAVVEGGRRDDEETAHEFIL